MLAQSKYYFCAFFFRKERKGSAPNVVVFICFRFSVCLPPINIYSEFPSYDRQGA